jgi:hypothetical protein
VIGALPCEHGLAIHLPPRRRGPRDHGRQRR